MNLLLISRDKKFIARIRKIYDDGITTLMVIPTIGWLLNRERVPKEPQVILFDITDTDDKWPRVVYNLRVKLDRKVIVFDHRAFWRRARTAFENYACRYLTKAKRTTDAKIRKAVSDTLHSALPLLPRDYAVIANRTRRSRSRQERKTK